MKKLRTGRRVTALAIVLCSVTSVFLAFAFWAVIQFHIAIAVAIALGLSAVMILGVYLISDKGISFDEEKFILKDGREFYYHEIDEVRVKLSEIYLRRYKAIVVRGEEVCIFDDLYQNAEEFKAILEKYGFTVPSDNRMMN